MLVCRCVVDDRYKRPVAAALRPDTPVTTTQCRDLPQHTSSSSSSSSSSETAGDVAVMRQAQQLTTEPARDELFTSRDRGDVTMTSDEIRALLTH